MDTLTFVFYDDITGAITRIFTVDQDRTDTGTNNAATGESFEIETAADAELEYYVAGVKTARPLLSDVATWDSLALDADGVDSVTLGSGLPNPTIIDIIVPVELGLQSQRIEEESGAFTLTTTIPGSYFVRIEVFPYVTQTFEIIAT